MKNSSGLIKHGSLMFLTVAVFNIINLLYQLYMVRNLSAVDYGILNSLFSILVIVSIPSGTLQTVVTKFTSTFYVINHHEKIKALLDSFIRKTIIFGLIVLFTIILTSKHISSFIQIESPFLIVILGVVTFLSVILPLTQGILQGLQRFKALGLIMVVNSGLKLLLGIILVSIGFGVAGAMAALVISLLITILLAFIILACIFRRSFALTLEPLQLGSNGSESEINFLEVYRYFYAVAAVLLCFMILTNADVLLVKHFFEPLEAGYYSIAQMAGKIILFLPIAITLVLFPKASNLNAQAKDTLHLLKKSLLCAVVLCGIAAITCFLFPDLIIKLISGEEHLHSIRLVRFFSVAMFFFALVYILLFYHLSIHHLGFIYSLVLITILQVLAISLFHQSLLQVLYIMCGCAILLFLINVRLAFKQKGIRVVSGIGSDS